MSPKNRFWALYGTWDGLVWGKILPRGVGTISRHCWQITILKIVGSVCPTIMCLTSFLELSLSCMFLTNCWRQNDRIDHGIISCFRRKKRLSWRNVTNKKSGWVSHFPSSFIIDLFHHVWEIQTSLSWIYFSSPPRHPLAPFGSLWGSPGLPWGVF